MQTIDRVSIEDRIRNVAERLFGETARSISIDSALVDSLPEFTSLTSLNLITATEEEFGIEVDFVSDDVKFSFSTLRNIAGYVQERLEDQVE